MADLDIAALRKLLEDYHAGNDGSIDHGEVQFMNSADALLDAAEERDRLRAQRDALLAAAEAVVDYDDEVEASGAQCPTAYQPLRANLLRAIAAAKETP